MKTATNHSGPPRLWHILRWLAIWFHEHELRSVDLAIEEEEMRHAQFANRIRSWRAFRAEKLGRVQSLRGSPGSTSYLGMTRVRPLPMQDKHAADDTIYSDRRAT